MKGNVKIQDRRVTFGHRTRAVAWWLGCFCVLVVTLPEVAFSAAIVVKGNLHLNGNSIVVDSFNSSDPAKSTNGQYDPAKADDEGDIYGGQTVSNLVFIGKSQVYGTLFVGPAVSEIVPYGVVGTHSWQALGGGGFEPGHLVLVNFAVADVAVPNGLSFFSPAPGWGVTQDGPPGNQSFLAQTNLPILGPGQSIVTISTNSSLTTTVTYPGPVPGLVTNFVTTATNAYPGDVPGLSTNCVSFVTITTDPGPQPCLTVSDLTTNVCPGPLEGLVTNVTIVTNAKPHMFITNYTYTYPLYTYADMLSYTYQISTYSYPISNYNYTIYTPWTYQTNYYDNILSGGNYFASNVLAGNTIITGPSTLVMASNFGGNIIIASGGSLSVYVQSGSCSINANSITNETGVASNLLIQCSPGVTTLTLSGTGTFAGVVDAPEANASISAGVGELDLSGTLAVNSLTASGEFRMHYDEALSESNLTVTSASAPPTMTLVYQGISTNSQFQFLGNALTAYGYNWVVETSTDLVNWTPIVTNSAAPFLFTDTNGISAGQRFYRTVCVQ